MNIHKPRAALAVAALAACTLAGTVRAADDYPSRPIRMEIGYAAGGPTDVLARILAKEMGEILKTSIVVENKPGASASIAAADVMRSEPDGYKVLVTSLTWSVNPLLYPGRYNYDPVKDLTPVSNICKLPMVLVTSYNSQYKDAKSLVADAKAHPGKLTYGSSGVGGSAHLAAEMMATSDNLSMTHVPFKGNGPALQEMLAGRISFMFYPSIGIANYVQQKQLRVLGVGTKEPLADFPGVPTMESLGYHNFDEGSPWVGLLVPPATPRPIVDRLNKAVNEALARPQVQQQFAALGAQAVGGSPEQFRDFLVQDKARWAEVIKRGNVKGED
ncbi:tripartite tricarboxylate transporter substrate binding protein [Bordetella sp. LUAb4]|uniref:Bug family tripartite tricarboxylate transporter substrate binding protein n=1 Tax=Bordetella sp. LUAb4 TaxID=2843195 RepID=UPI001E6328B9|nr:tripartite tricarboxylate transporter substrate binding protein [Bordetella sp. LUAb4]